MQIKGIAIARDLLKVHLSNSINQAIILPNPKAARASRRSIAFKVDKKVE